MGTDPSMIDSGVEGLAAIYYDLAGNRSSIGSDGERAILTVTHTSRHVTFDRDVTITIEDGIPTCRAPWAGDFSWGAGEGARMSETDTHRTFDLNALILAQKTVLDAGGDQREWDLTEFEVPYNPYEADR